MSQTTTDTTDDASNSDFESGNDHPLTTALDIARTAAKATDVDPSEYDSETRESIVGAIELIVRADQSAQLSSSSSAEDSTDRPARREMLAALISKTTTGKSPGAESQKVRMLEENLSRARRQSDAFEGFVLPVLLEMALVVPSRQPYYSRGRVKIPETLDGSGKRLLSQLLKYVEFSGGSQSLSESDPCPFFGPTDEMVEERRESRVEQRAEIEDRLQEHYLAMAPHLDEFLKAAEEHKEFMAGAWNKPGITGDPTKNRQVKHARTALKKADNKTLRILSEAVADAEEEIESRAKSRR